MKMNLKWDEDTYLTHFELSYHRRVFVLIGLASVQLEGI